MSEPVYKGRTGALMTDWDCLRQYVAVYELYCGELTSYAARHTRAMANLCNAGLPVSAWQSAMLQQCGAPKPSF